MPTPTSHPTNRRSGKQAAPTPRGVVSETTALDEVGPAGDADSVPETPGDNNEERPVDYGGA